MKVVTEKYDGAAIRRRLKDDGTSRVELYEAMKIIIKDEICDIKIEAGEDMDIIDILCDFDIDYPESSMLYRLLNLVNLIKTYKEIQR